MIENKFLKIVTPNESPPINSKTPVKKIRVGPVQLNTSFSGQYYFPLAVGMLQAYAQRHLSYPDYYEFSLPIYKFMRVEEASEMLSDCDIAIFSSYVWCEQNSLAIARDYKRRNPKGIVVFGGPQVPDSKKQFRRVRTAELNEHEQKQERIHFTEDYHRAYPFIDLAIHGEGERAFRYALEQMAIDGCLDRSNIPSASYFNPDGTFHYNPKIARMIDSELAETPSPFTTGIFDRLIEAYPDQKWIMMYETDRGCPYQCSYCDWGGATEDKISKFPMEQIYKDFMWAGENKIPYIFLCNANFGIIPRDIQVAEFLAETKARFGFLQGVSTQNAKNPKKHTIQALKILEKAGLNKATVMSQQTLNRESLREVRRENMDLTEYEDMQRQLAAEGVYTMTDYIIPLPKETYQSLLSGISTLITNGQHNRIQFNNLSILRNTEMGNPEYQRRNGFQIVKIPITNIHGKKNSSISGINELQELVVATSTMPPEDWIKARTLCWMVNLVYFNKLLQIPIIILNKVYGIAYSEIFESLMSRSQSSKFLIFSEIYEFFQKTATDIQAGTQEEFIHSAEWLDILWPPEEYIFIKLCFEKKLENFYKESEKIFCGLIGPEKNYQPAYDAIKLNRSLIKIPFQNEDLPIRLSHNVWNIYRSAILGKDAELELGDYTHLVDRTSEKWNSWDDWCEKMVWWGNRRGAYLYGNRNPLPDLEGHH